jgi:lysozyme family protein
MDASDAAIIEGIIDREGGRGKLTNTPGDAGGRTFEGISERANPDLWRAGPPSHADVLARYEERYVKGPGFDRIADLRLRNQLVDFGVTSGPAIAIMALQRSVGVPPDGVLGHGTLGALAALDPRAVGVKVTVERLQMIARLVAKNPSQLKFLVGWITRATEFLS